MATVSETRQKLLTVRKLNDELIEKGFINDTQRIIDILTERAQLLDALEEPDEAQTDRITARFIERHPHETHSEKCFKRAGEINLRVIAERNEIPGLFDTTDNVR